MSNEFHFNSVKNTVPLRDIPVSKPILEAADALHKGFATQFAGQISAESTPMKFLHKRPQLDQLQEH